MSLKLPSLKRTILLSLVFVALLGSLIYLQAGEEMESYHRVGDLFSSALEDGESWAQRVRLPPSWNGEPSSGYHLQSPSETSAPARLNSSVSDTAPSSSTPVIKTLEFNSSVNSTLFRTWGVLTIEGGSTLPYLILNATLWAGDRPVEGARYMMMDLEPGSCREFDIRKVCRIAPRANYSCLLEVEGSDGIFLPQEIDCLIAEGDPEFAIWDGRELSEELNDTSNELVSDFGSSLQEKPEREVMASDEYGYKYVGSKTSDKYHWPDCSYAKKIKPENRITFSDEEEAQEAGYSPCGVCCKPPY